MILLTGLQDLRDATRDIRISGKLEYFLTNIMIQFSLNSVHIWKSYSKNTKVSQFYGRR